jgi:hypothetical protein
MLYFSQNGHNYVLCLFVGVTECFKIMIHFPIIKKQAVNTYMSMQTFRAYGVCKKTIRLTTIQTSLGHFPNDKFRPLSKRI